MSLRSLLSGLFSRWESAFDRANGEFISMLIIDHGATSRDMRRRLYD